MRIQIYKGMEKMTEPQQPQQNPFMIDVRTILPTIAKMYSQFHWIIPMLGFNVPPEIHQTLISIAEGKPLSPEQVQQLKTQAEAMKPMVGEPVMTRQLAETAWYLHYKEGMGTREIAEQFTKDGNPCSHATVARWINAIDMEKRYGRIARLIQIGKILGFAGLMFLAFWIGKTFF